MKKLFILSIVTLSGLYLITHNEYIKILLTASIITYFLILIHIIFACIYGIIKTMINNGFLETLSELEIQIQEIKKEEEEAKLKKEERRNIVKKLFNINIYF